MVPNNQQDPLNNLQSSSCDQSDTASKQITKFAFLIHPLSKQSLSLLNLNHGDSMLNDWNRGSFFDLIQQTHHAFNQQILSSNNNRSESKSVRFVDVVHYYSGNSSAIGRLYEIPMSASEFLRDPDRALMYMEEATMTAISEGAQLIGLGSLTAIVGNHGEYLAEKSLIPVTTGNSLTVYAAIQNMNRIISELSLTNRRLQLTVIGIPGSIASAIALNLSKMDYHLAVAARKPSIRSERLAKEWNAVVHYDLAQAVKNADIVISATSSGGCIDPSWLKPGAVVLDVGVPSDVLPENQPRRDIIVLSAGYSRVPKSTPRTSKVIRFFQGVIPSCLAETITLALDRKLTSYSIGRELIQERIQEIGLSAIRHGFNLAPLLSQGLEIDDSRLIHIRKIIARQSDRRRRRTSSHHLSESNDKTISTDERKPIQSAQVENHLNNLDSSSSFHTVAKRAQSLHQRYINPVLIKLSDDSKLIKTFVRGDGVYLYDASGERYLDFVAGYGSVNHGHNHPKIVSAVQTALSNQAPGFIPSSVNPYTSKLAEELITIAPDSLEMVFFTNSGAESIEAALKLARIATGRRQFLACEKSYHGKTLGALSVTMNSRYQTPFQPLIPHVQSIAYNNLESLSSALQSHQFAAFIVEPIQGEGGMIVPEPGYLKSVENLCRLTGTLLIVDEIQTGFGRTGKMFAVEHEDVQPDILTLAKSLSGGLIPIGAMLARRDLWMKAYGTFQTFALHTSTFSGGSLACSAGSAAIQVLLDDGLIENARIQGNRLRSGLLAIAQRTKRIKDVRGVGLMIGLELNPMSDVMRKHHQGADSNLSIMIPGYDEMISSFPTIYLTANLLEHYKIFTQAARSNSNVMRIQPSLLIHDDQVDYFLNAVESILTELDSLGFMLSSILSKSVGEIDKSTD